ncbi:MAG: azoreductase [Frankiales bacterium]|nr:azoreductase [Frankiales bacterium]
MIVVFGSTGTIGSEVLRQLVEQGPPVRAVVRSQQAADRLAGGSTEVVRADLADPGSLPAALAGADRVFLATPASAEQVRLESNLIDALAGSSVPLVKLAALGFDAVPADQAIALAANHGRIVEHARAQGVALTVLAPSGFTSNLLASAGTIAQGALYGSAGDGGVAWVDPADVGAVAAHVLTSSGHEGATYSVTGPDLLTFAQLAELLTAELGREVSYVDVPAGQFAQTLQGAGLDAWTADALDELHQLYRAHLSEVVTDEVSKATGRKPRSVQQWLAEHAAAFAG